MLIEAFGIGAPACLLASVLTLSSYLQSPANRVSTASHQHVRHVCAHSAVSHVFIADLLKNHLQQMASVLVGLTADQSHR